MSFLRRIVTPAKAGAGIHLSGRVGLGPPIPDIETASVLKINYNRILR
jgi:hypothetical protein